MQCSEEWCWQPRLCCHSFAARLLGDSWSRLMPMHTGDNIDREREREKWQKFILRLSEVSMQGTRPRRPCGRWPVTNSTAGLSWLQSSQCRELAHSGNSLVHAWSLNMPCRKRMEKDAPRNACLRSLLGGNGLHHDDGDVDMEPIRKCSDVGAERTVPNSWSLGWWNNKAQEKGEGLSDQ
jgi:hypothetical protein